MQGPESTLEANTPLYDSDHEDFRERGYSNRRYQGRYGRSRSSSPRHYTEAPMHGTYGMQNAKTPLYDSDIEGFRERGYSDRRYKGRYGLSRSSSPRHYTE